MMTTPSVVSSGSASHAKVAKSLYPQQLALIGEKSALDSSLLDHIAQFIRKKLEIERDAADKLDKLLRQYQKIAAILFQSPSSKSPASKTPSNAQDDELTSPPASRRKSTLSSDDTKPMLLVFNGLLAQTDIRIKETLSLCDSLSSSVIGPSVDFVREKQTNTSKCIDLWRPTYDHLSTCLITLSDRRKDYDEAAKDVAHATKKHTALSVGKTSVLSTVKAALSSISDEERITRSSSKLAAATERLTDARNQYFIALAASNAAQTAYWEIELPRFFDRIDGDFHPTFAQAITQYASSESALWDKIRLELNDFAGAAASIDRDVEQELFQRTNRRLFPGPSIFNHDPAKGDPASPSRPTLVIPDEKTKTAMSTLLHELMTRRQALGKENEKSAKEITGLIQLAKVYEKTPNFGQAANPLETKLSLELQSVCRSVQLQSIEAQITVLENSGVSITGPIVNVETTTTSIMHLVAEDMDFQATPVDPVDTPKRTTKAFDVTVKRARVLFPYDAQDPSEISIQKGDIVDILDADQSGWTRVSLNNREGYIPSDYIQTDPSLTSPAETLTRASTATPIFPVIPLAKQQSTASESKTAICTALCDYVSQTRGELSFAAGDSIRVIETCLDAGTGAPSEWWNGLNVRTGEQGLFPHLFTEGWEAALNLVTRGGPRLSNSRVSLPTNRTEAPEEEKVTVLFEYVATCAGEFNLSVGDVIVVTNKNTGSEAWWEGRNDQTGASGQFPHEYTIPSTGSQQFQPPLN